MEKELANFDPSRPGLPNGRVERGELQTGVYRGMKHALLPVLCRQSLPAVLPGEGVNVWVTRLNPS